MIGALMDLLDPLVLRLMGPHINRTTAQNVKKAALEIERMEELAPGGAVKLIVARARKRQNRDEGETGHGRRERGDGRQNPCPAG